MAGQGQPQMTQEELIEALLDACGRSKDQARAEELLGWGADPNALPYRYRTVTSMHYTRQFYGAMSRLWPCCSAEAPSSRRALLPVTIKMG
jgi:hypothetical protein